MSSNHALITFAPWANRHRARPVGRCTGPWGYLLAFHGFVQSRAMHATNAFFVIDSMHSISLEVKPITMHSPAKEEFFSPGWRRNFWWLSEGRAPLVLDCSSWFLFCWGKRLIACQFPPRHGIQKMLKKNSFKKSERSPGLLFVIGTCFVFWCAPMIEQRAIDLPRRHPVQVKKREIFCCRVFG